MRLTRIANYHRLKHIHTAILAIPIYVANIVHYTILLVSFQKSSHVLEGFLASLKNPESPPLYYFASALIDFSRSPNLKWAKELTKRENRVTPNVWQLFRY